MTDIQWDRRGQGRDGAVGAILEAAWALMARDGVAALSVRQLARDLGIRQQSLTYYFPSKQELFDALFADGFRRLRPVLQAAGKDGDDPVARLEDTAEAFLRYCVTHPARYHLMLQRTVPGFRPGDESHAVALSTLQVLLDRLADAGVERPEDLAAVRGLLNGLAAEQIANDPGGTSVLRHARHALRALLAGLALETHDPLAAT